MHFQFRNLKTNRVTLAWSMGKFPVLPYYAFNFRKTMIGKYHSIFCSFRMSYRD